MKHLLYNIKGHYTSRLEGGTKSHIGGTGTLRKEGRIVDIPGIGEGKMRRIDNKYFEK